MNNNTSTVSQNPEVIVPELGEKVITIEQEMNLGNGRQVAEQVTQVAPLLSFQKEPGRMEVEEEKEQVENQKQDGSLENKEEQIGSMMEDRNDEDINQSEADTKSKTERRCFNVKCQSTKNLKKVKSRAVKAKYRNFCTSCYEYYTRNQFCEYCQQVYGDNQGDDSDWMGCDYCDRWNHISCEQQNRKTSSNWQQNNKYSCIQCTQLVKDKPEPKRSKPQTTTFNDQDVYQYQKPKSKKRTIRQLRSQQIHEQYSNSNPNSVNIFNRPKQMTIYFETFLNSISNGYKHCLSDFEIKQDFRNIKSSVEPLRVQASEKRR